MRRTGDRHRYRGELDGARRLRASVSAPRVVGYDYVLSIEHEDGLMSVREGLAKAAALLKEAVIGEPATTMWWT